MIKIAALRLAGLTDAQIVAVKEQEEQQQYEERLAQREAARQRQIACRARKRTAAGVMVPAVVGAEAVTATPVPPAPNAPVPVLEARRAGATIPADWRPDMSGIMMADAKGLSQEQVDIEVRRFVDYYTSTGTVRVDWNAAFRAWLNSPFFENSQRVRVNGNGHRSHLQQWEDAYSALDRFARGGGGLGASAVQPVFAAQRS